MRSSASTRTLSLLRISSKSVRTSETTDTCSWTRLRAALLPDGFDRFETLFPDVGERMRERTRVPVEFARRERHLGHGHLRFLDPNRAPANDDEDAGLGQHVRARRLARLQDQPFDVHE